MMVVLGREIHLTSLLSMFDMRVLLPPYEHDLHFGVPVIRKTWKKKFDLASSIAPIEESALQIFLVSLW